MESFTKDGQRTYYSVQPPLKKQHKRKQHFNHAPSPRYAPFPKYHSLDNHPKLKGGRYSPIFQTEYLDYPGIDRMQPWSRSAKLHDLVNDYKLASGQNKPMERDHYDTSYYPRYEGQIPLVYPPFKNKEGQLVYPPFKFQSDKYMYPFLKNKYGEHMYPVIRHSQDESMYQPAYTTTSGKHMKRNKAGKPSHYMHKNKGDDQEYVPYKHKHVHSPPHKKDRLQKYDDDDINWP